MIAWALKYISGGWVYIIIAGAFAAVLGYAWVLHAERDSAREEADAAHALAKAAETINQSNKISIDTQNKKIDEMVSAGKAREEKAAADAIIADQKAKPHEARAAAYLAMKPPQSNVCETARGYVDDYIKTRAH